MDGNQSCNMQHQANEGGGCNGNCKGPAHGMRRHFMIKDEKTERLKEYAEQLRKELQGVEEKIRELQD